MVDSLELMREASRRSALDDIFGAGSRLVESHGVREDVTMTLVDLPLYETAVVVCLLLYIVWIIRHTSYGVGNMLRSSVILGGKLGRSSEAGYKRRVRDLILSWCLIVGLAIILSTRVLDWVSRSEMSHYISPFNITEYIISIGFEYWCAGMVAAFLGSLIWGSMITYMSRLIFRNKAFFREIMQLKGSMMLMSVLWMLPVVLISSFEDDNSFLVYLTLFEVVILCGVYLFRSFSLFTAQKISILQWFLYLCTVEIMPITLAWAFFTRSVSV